MNALIEQELLAVLQKLDQTVRQLPVTNPKPSLLPLFALVDELMVQLPAGTDPTLLHYLHKKSYEKARLYLEGRDAENQRGNCQHV